jgi:hypothetical protein
MFADGGENHRWIVYEYRDPGFKNWRHIFQSHRFWDNQAKQAPITLLDFLYIEI